MQQIVLLAPWNSYADAVDHYCYVRCLDVGNLYEVVRVTHDKHGQQAEFVHQVIFMTEYSEPALAETCEASVLKSWTPSYVRRKAPVRIPPGLRFGRTAVLTEPQVRPGRSTICCSPA